MAGKAAPSPEAVEKLPTQIMARSSLVTYRQLAVVGGVAMNVSVWAQSCRLTKGESAHPDLKSNSGMPSFLALSARLSEMPEPGNTTTPIGRVSSS